MFQWDASALPYGVTAVENRFLLDYLPAAKGDFVKVYLWGLFACAHKDQDYALEEMAQELMLTVPEIEAALRYWERRGLVARISEAPPAYRFFSPSQRQQTGGDFFQADAEYVDFSEAVYAIFSDRRKIHPGEITFLWEWVVELGLQAEVVLMLINHCVAQRGVNFSFKKAQPLAVRMKEEKVLTPDDAEMFLRHNQSVYDGAKKVLSRMGKRRFPSDDEMDMYEKWIDAWKFDPQAVLDACRETTSGDPSFKYLDSILRRLQGESDARSPAQVKKTLQTQEEERLHAQELFNQLGAPLPAATAKAQYAALLKIQPREVLLQAARIARRSETGKLDALEDLALSWKSQGLTNEKDVKAHLARYLEVNRSLRALFAACGHAGRPAPADRVLYEKWTGYGMDQELLLFAAQQARGAQGNKIAYLDKVIDAWHEAGITQLSQAQAQQKPTGGKRAENAPVKTVSAQRYTQRTYTEEELNAISDDLIEEARRQRE